MNDKKGLKDIKEIKNRDSIKRHIEWHIMLFGYLVYPIKALNITGYRIQLKHGERATGHIITCFK